MTKSLATAAWTTFLTMSLSTWAWIFTLTEAKPKIPVVLVPGDGGSQLQVKLNRTTVPHYICQKTTSDYTSIWLNLEELLPAVIDCFVDNMRLRYDKTDRTTHNAPGVDIRPVEFGKTVGIEWLDGSPVTHVTSSLSYFYNIVTDLVAVGYERGKSVRGAPFDFRKAPNEMQEFYKKFKALIEETYSINNNTQVAIVGHSMGNPVTLYFLNQMTQAWKDKYIHSFTSLAGVWGGAVKTIRLMASGDELGVVVINALKVRPEQRSMPSTAFLMPSEMFWKHSEPLVFTEHRNYSVADYKDFFRDIGFDDGYEMRLDTQNLIKNLTAPGVPVNCVHGSNVPTPAGFVYPPGTFPDIYPKVVEGDGDGTVNMRSLLGCLKWTKTQTQPVKHKVIPKAEHMEILKLPEVSKYIIQSLHDGR